MRPLLVIVPSRARPAAVADLWAAWCATAYGEADLLVCLDDDDDTRHDYPPGPIYSIGPRNGFAPRLTAEAVDNLDRYALASWGDDHIPLTRGWDRELVLALEQLGTGFVYGDDTLQGEALPTACAMTSDIVRALGWMTPPGMAHLYVDNVWLELGRAIDRIRYLPEVVIEHRHPVKVTKDRSRWHPLTAEANTPEAYRADRAVFDRWKAEQMPADVETLRGLL